MGRSRGGLTTKIHQRTMKRRPKPGLPRLFDRPKYRQQNFIEWMFDWLKENRRISTRHDKLARSFGAMATLAARCDAYGSVFRTEPRDAQWISSQRRRMESRR